MNWTAVAAITLGVAVMLGAFGAHGLKDRLDAYSMSIYEKAVFYHFIHALGILIVSILPRERLTVWVCRLLFAGILVFSGSLYVLAVTGVSTMGVITPFGGLAFIAGWFLLAYSLLRRRI